MAKTDTWSVPDDRVTITHVIGNYDSIMSGSTLEPYLKALFGSTGVNNPYHNLRHSLHVMRNAYLAARYHSKELSTRQTRNIVIAAMLHDMNHSGRAKPGYDHLEIPRAIYGFQQCMRAEDERYQEDIARLIKATMFPVPAQKEWTLSEMIMQDADMTQTFGVAWVQQVAVGLAAEWDMTPLEILRNQKGFLSKIEWRTEWGQKSFPPEVIQAKIDEAEAYVSMLS